MERGKTSGRVDDNEESLRKRYIMLSIVGRRLIDLLSITVAYVFVDTDR